MTVTRTRRGLILFVVFAAHMVFVTLMLREERQRRRLPAESREPVALSILPINRAKTAVVKIPPELVVTPLMPRSALTFPTPEFNQDEAVIVTPENLPPPIDWQEEIEIASKNAVKNAEARDAYRNLSALSPAQLRWVRDNHFEPAAPGIAWTYRRVEVTQGGFPIIHINDHCVAVPFLVMMVVFCKIGHLEPNGGLFDHMRDARPH